MPTNQTDALTGEYVRPMSFLERITWQSSLAIAATLNRDDAEDWLARRANNLEEASLRHSERGRDFDASDAWRASELCDVARSALIR